MSCSTQETTESDHQTETIVSIAIQDTIPVMETVVPTDTAMENFLKEDWVLIDPDSFNVVWDIRYATTNNFVDSILYPCGKCLLRPPVASALKQVSEKLQQQHYTLKMFDCYRPLDVQWALWNKVPNPSYVTPPKKGSMHNRGMAVDLTLVDSLGQQLDMGSPYDFFGRAAHIDNMTLPKEVLDNRAILHQAMTAAGFKGIRTEWWHFNYQGKQHPISKKIWPCH